MARKKRGFFGFLIKFLILVAICGGVGYVVYERILQHRGQQAATANVATFTVAEGPLLISVTEAGTIKPREQVVIKSRVEGRSTILSLVPEGTRVKKGDLLVELDATTHEDNKVDQEIKVQNADASFVQSRENLEVVKNQAEADIDKAELTLRFAKEDLRKYQEGEFPNEKADLESRITLAKEEVQRTADKLEWSQRLFAEKYLSETELRADKLAAQKAEIDLKLANSNLSLLTNYTYKRKVDQFESDAKQAEMALDRVKRKASADIVQAESQLRAREAELKRQQGKLKKIEDQISKAKIYAPTDGSVVYATSTQFSWRGNVEPLDEGQEVRERQELIHLPTANTFMAETNIHEASLKKIYPGLPVRLTIDALPGRSFSGKVSKIAPLPDPRSMFMNPDLKVYKTEIQVEGGGDVLRTGMTCQVEVIIEHHEKAMFVPVQCVIRVGGKPTVFVHAGMEDKARTVEIGLDNNRMVQIKSGLKVGEKVLLNPPLGSSVRKRSADAPANLKVPPRPTQTRKAAPSKPGEGDNEARPRKDGNGERPSAAEREKRRKAFENASPEERERMRKQFMKNRSGQ